MALWEGQIGDGNVTTMCAKLSNYGASIQPEKPKEAANAC